MEDYNEFKVLATDGEIDLAMPTYVDESYKHFDIFLHNTNTFVGYIWYDNTDDEEIVSEIIPDYLSFELVQWHSLILH